MAVPRPATPRPEPGAMLPLAEGNRWTYRVTDSRYDDPHEETTWVFGEVPVPPVVVGDMPVPGPVRCHQVFRRAGQRMTFEYWRSDARGVFRHDPAIWEQMRGPGHRYRTMLPLPVGIETRWEWSREDPDAPAPADEPASVASRTIHSRADLIAPAESVSVPFGTLKAVHVRIRSECRWSEPKIHDLWFAPGIGLVRETETGAVHTIVRELSAFVPGPASPPPVDRDAVARAHLAALSGWAEAEIELRWLPPTTAHCYLRGSFAIVRRGERRTCLWQHGENVELFEPADRAFWQARWRETVSVDREARQHEGLPGREAPGHDDVSWGLHALAKLAGQLHAATLRHTDVVEVSSTTSMSVGAGPVECEAEIGCAASDAAGKPIRFTATMKAKDDKLLEVGFGG